MRKIKGRTSLLAPQIKSPFSKVIYKLRIHVTIINTIGQRPVFNLIKLIFIPEEKLFNKIIL